MRRFVQSIPVFVFALTVVFPTMSASAQAFDPPVVVPFDGPNGPKSPTPQRPAAPTPQPTQTPRPTPVSQPAPAPNVVPDKPSAPLDQPPSMEPSFGRAPEPTIPCGFAMGFFALRGLLGDSIIGACLEDAQGLPNGDYQQHSGGGVFTYWVAGRTASFSDGNITYIDSSEHGFEIREANQRFAWEPDADQGFDIVPDQAWTTDGNDANNAYCSACDVVGYDLLRRFGTWNSGRGVRVYPH